MDIASVAVGCDHAGFPYKDELIASLRARGLVVQDFGTHSGESVDYPDFVHPVARAVGEQPGTVGLLICGSANGVAMAANKHAGVRAAVCWNEEIAVLARTHNDANVLCLPARFVSVDEARAMTKAFLESEFEGGRHARRVAKIDPRAHVESKVE